VSVFVKSILDFFSSNLNLSASSIILSENLNFNQASIISDSSSIHFLSLSHKTSIILHSGLFHSHLVIFIATLSQFFIFLKSSNFLYAINTSFLNKELSKITKA
jgi:hypothetical protein